MDGLGRPYTLASWYSLNCSSVCSKKGPIENPDQTHMAHQLCRCTSRLVRETIYSLPPAFQIPTSTLRSLNSSLIFPNARSKLPLSVSASKARTSTPSTSFSSV
jgi:hypothetical protein